jgi:ParB/RepB/Spo0J family partition protein
VNKRNRNAFFVPIDLIDPPQKPIRDAQAALINDLRESIKEKGILQSLLLRPKPDGRYEIVFGLQRYYAAKGAGLKEVPATVRELSDHEAIILALAENIQRQAIDPIREGEIFYELIREGESIENLAKEIGKSKTYIEGRIKLYRSLDEEVKREIGKTLTLTNALHLANYNKQFQRQVLQEMKAVSKKQPQSQIGWSSFVGGIPKYCICPTCGSKHVPGRDYSE